MKALKLIVVSLILFIPISAQKLPKLDKKPTPKFESPSFCPKEGLKGSDAELNMAKNRIDESDNYFPVDFEEVKGLHNADGAAEKDRDSNNLKPEDKKEIQKYEGLPIRIEGFLALVKDGRNLVGAVVEGKEKCNCDRTEPDHVDYHLWLTGKPDNDITQAVVVEMTPRVRIKHSRWIVKDLTFIAAKKFPVRISGWMMFDGEHKEQLFNPDNPDKPKSKIRRATLWEIHPIMKVEYKQSGRWKTL
jgi:hypothetical protein